MTVLFWIAVIVLFLNIAIILEITLGMRRMTNIKHVKPTKRQDTPKVSVIIPACNEADTIKPALQSVLELDYANLEVIVVNDRSTDNTDAVIERIKAQYPDLILHKITELPKGWMGKSHALQAGAERARGEYLLFTDADIIMEKTTLSRAMHHMLENKLGHASILFKPIAPGGLLNALVMDVAGGLMLLCRPWKVKEKNSNKYIGVGAFNLVKASAYKEIDGHSTFSMHPIDDIMLGKIIKQKGFSQDCLIGFDFVQVKWYDTISEAIDGFMKNSFAFYHYRLSEVFLSVFFTALVSILPFWAFLFTSGITRILFGAAVIARILSFMNSFLKVRISPWYSLWSLIPPYINIYITIKAAINTILNKGITWRGTHYRYEELITIR